LWGTPVRALIWTSGAARPPANPVSIDIGIRSLAKCGCGETRVSRYAATASTPKPAAIRHGGPTIPTSFAPLVAAVTKDVTVVASQATPVRLGE
jgi:hypothetical protein